MVISAKKISNAIKEFVYLQTFDEKVLGVMVFGSLAKGMLRKTSDIDILLLTKGGERLRTIKEYDCLKFEIYKVPKTDFASPFFSGKNLPFDTFRLQVLRSGKILYDLDGTLSWLSVKARTQKIPRFYMNTMLKRACRLLGYARNHFRMGRLERAESALQSASVELARALLLGMDEPEVNTPRLLIPHLRRRFPDFHKIFCEIQGINGAGKHDAESALIDFSTHLSRVTDKFCRIQYDIEEAKTEFLNAKDCLEYGDYESAILQLRLSANILRRALREAKFPICSFSSAQKPNRSLIREYFSILKDHVEEYATRD